MKSTRLYYTDSMLREFDARVVACEAAGDHFHILLDQTAFYPTSGGQPFDTGNIAWLAEAGSAEKAAIRIVEVIDPEDGTIRHVAGQAIAPGTAVHGAVDWPRRFDHMQQHTGQHVLSAAFDRLLGVRTMSFHMGTDVSTIDLAREVSPKEIADAEREANRVVWEDHPVVIKFASDEEAAKLPLRKEPVRSGELRLVEVPGFDLSACGGTHVPRTGMIGVIAVTGWERFKGATRLSFACGARALASHAALRDVVTASVRILSVLPVELPTALERLQSDMKDSSKVVRRLQEELAGFRAVTLRQQAETIGPYRGVLMAQPETDAAVMKSLAMAIVSEPGFIVVFAGQGEPSPVVIARSADVAIDAGAWMKRATAALGGRGGGRPDQAQGGIAVSADQVLSYARQTLL